LFLNVLLRRRRRQAELEGPSQESAF
jgi:hypothetical protein